MPDGTVLHGFQIGGGYGARKATNFRIGHLGDHARTELEWLLQGATERIT